MKKIILSLFLVVSLTAFSQRGYLDNYNYHGGYGFESKHILKTDISQMFYANISFMYEYRFHQEYSIEAGIGLLTHSFFKPVFQPVMTNPLYSELKGGYSLHLQPSYFVEGLGDLYVAIPFNYRRHGSQAESYEFGVSVGYQFHLSERLSLDVEFGWAFNIEYTLDGVSYIYNNSGFDPWDDRYSVRMLYPLTIKLGYVL